LRLRVFALKQIRVHSWLTRDLIERRGGLRFIHFAEVRAARALTEKFVQVELNHCRHHHGASRTCIHDMAFSIGAAMAIKNGDLIRLEEAEFDLFTSYDQNIRYQQKLSGRRISILELTSNDLRRVLAIGANITTAIEAISPGEYFRLDIP